MFTGKKEFIRLGQKKSVCTAKTTGNSQTVGQCDITDACCVQKDSFKIWCKNHNYITAVWYATKIAADKQNGNTNYC